MAKCKIDVWQFVPEPDGDEPCFQTYLLAGTHEGRVFIIKVSMEIDGRDAEYDQIAGLGMRWDADDPDERNRWDDLLVAMKENEGLRKDMADRVNAILG